MARPYLRVARRASRGEADARVRRDLLAAPAELPRGARGELAPRRRDAARACTVAGPGGESLFPGFVIGLLALVGALGSVFLAEAADRARRGHVGVCALLSLGVRDVDGPASLPDAVPLPLRLRARLGRRADPGRINTLTSLGLALLAGAGVCVVTSRSLEDDARRGSRTPRLAFWSSLDPGRRPRAAHPPTRASAACGRPPRSPRRSSICRRLRGRRSLHATGRRTGFPKTVNGSGGSIPTGYDRLRKEIAGFPDAQSVRRSARARRADRALPSRSSRRGTALGGRPRASRRRGSASSAAGRDVIVFRLRPSSTIAPCASWSSTAGSSRGTVPRTSSPRSATTTRATSRRRRRSSAPRASAARTRSSSRSATTASCTRGRSTTRRTTTSTASARRTASTARRSSCRGRLVRAARFSREEGVALFGTAFDEPSADFLAELDMPAFKIASGDLTNVPLPPLRRGQRQADVRLDRRRARSRTSIARSTRSSRSTSSSACSSARRRTRARSRSSTSGSSRLTASATRSSSSGSPTTRAGSRCRSSATCSARA